MSATLTPKQIEANRLLAGPATHCMLFGGSRSGKTFLLCRAIAVRALKAPDSRHAILRHRFNHLKASIWHDTWPKMMKLCWPEVPYKSDKSDWFIEFPNSAQIWFGGLDEKERTEKILGQEYATVFLNECSQISFAARELVRTRLAQKTSLALKFYYDENPPLRTHWTHRLFEEKRNPEPPYEPLVDADNYAAMRVNPSDNADNLPAQALKELQTLSTRARIRFWEGRWGETTENALWTYESISANRVKEIPDLQRIIIGVDPSGTSGPEDERSDKVGIVVVALGTDGQAYVLEDLTLNASPAVWGRVIVHAYQRYDADLIVAETNFGGAMVDNVVRGAASELKVRVHFMEVKASRGQSKVVRAEPISLLYEGDKDGRGVKVHHAGVFAELEDQLCAFTTVGYMGDRSPDRADALVWALTALFPGMTRKARKTVAVVGVGVRDYQAHRF